MGDVFTREKRSQVMARIRAKDTKPELAVRRALHLLGFRFRLHAARLPGRPDIVIKKHRTVFQVKGCFWHGHRCLKGRVPGVNRAYWLEKIRGNKARDRRNDRRLRVLGWRVRTVWECRVRRWSPEALAAHLRQAMKRVRRKRPGRAGRARRGAGGRRAAARATLHGA